MGKIQLLSKLFKSALQHRACLLNSGNLNHYNVKLCQNIRPIHTSRYLQVSDENKQTVLVYEGPLKKRIKMVKILSLSSSLLGFAVLPIVLKDVYQSSILLTCAVGAISTGFLSTPLLLHWITKRYVIELNFDSQTQTFLAKTYNLISQEKEIQFNASDVKIPDLPGMLTSFQVKDSPLFVDANLVKDPDAYSLMMGYDKPYDFKLESEREQENT